MTSTTCAVIRERRIEKPVLFQYENLIIQCAKGLFLLKMFATWFQVTLCDRSHLQTFDARLPFVCGEVTESTGVGNIANAFANHTTGTKAPIFVKVPPFLRSSKPDLENLATPPDYRVGIITNPPTPYKITSRRVLTRLLCIKK